MRYHQKLLLGGLVLLLLFPSCRYNKIMAEADPKTEAEVTKEEVKEEEIRVPITPKEEDERRP